MYDPKLLLDKLQRHIQSTKATYEQAVKRGRDNPYQDRALEGRFFRRNHPNVRPPYVTGGWSSPPNHLLVPPCITIGY